MGRIVGFISIPPFLLPDREKARMRVNVQTKRRDPPGSRLILVLLFNSAATHASTAHMQSMMGVNMMMDGDQLHVHDGGIISGGRGVVNQITESSPLLRCGPAPAAWPNAAHHRRVVRSIASLRPRVPLRPQTDRVFRIPVPRFPDSPV